MPEIVEKTESEIFAEICAVPVSGPELLEQQPDQPEQPDQPDGAIPVFPAELILDAPVKRGRGRHPKDCKCGRCKGSQSANNAPGAGPSVIGTPGQPSDTPGEVPGALVAESTPIPVTDYKLLSEMIFDTGTNALSIGFGEEWKPRSELERDNVCISLAAYLKSKEVKDIPPGMMLTIVLVAYSAPRFQAPSTRDKIKIGWLKVKTLFKRKKKE